MKTIKPLHPFPARMAPEIVTSACAALPVGSTILDPMSGSGTVLRISSQCGHSSIGFDIDPLSVLLSKVWTTPIDTDALRKSSIKMLNEAIRTSYSDIHLPWLTDCDETKEFINFWFAEKQKIQLTKLASLLNELQDPIGDALRLSLSRLIITKKRGASLAWDVSHSRPHKTRDTNDYDVLSEFDKSVAYVARLLETQQPGGNTRIRLGDARNLSQIKDGTIDAIITSPPYLNAIDYMRGHRMSLVWLGFTISQLRQIRSTMVGAERGPSDEVDSKLATKLCLKMGAVKSLPTNRRKMIVRYVQDILAIVKETNRVLKPGGQAIFVVGNSQHNEVFVKNTEALKAAASFYSLKLISERERPLPNVRRYLPPPKADLKSDLKKRMRTEVICHFIRE